MQQWCGLVRGCWQWGLGYELWRRRCCLVQVRMATLVRLYCVMTTLMNEGWFEVKRRQKVTQGQCHTKREKEMWRRIDSRRQWFVLSSTFFFTNFYFNFKIKKQKTKVSMSIDWIESQALCHHCLVVFDLCPTQKKKRGHFFAVSEPCSCRRHNKHLNMPLHSCVCAS